jgi:hypothetical protein
MTACYDCQDKRAISNLDKTACLVCGDGEEAPQVYCAAVDRNQARIVYKAAMAMARSTPSRGCSPRSAPKCPSPISRSMSA